MKPATVVHLLQGIVALLHAATLRALAAEAQRVAAKLERGQV